MFKFSLRAWGVNQIELSEIPVPPAHIICYSQGFHFLHCLCFITRLTGQAVCALGSKSFYWNIERNVHLVPICHFLYT